jgi:hypothetical protein
MVSKYLCSLSSIQSRHLRHATNVFSDLRQVRVGIRDDYSACARGLIRRKKIDREQKLFTNDEDNERSFQQKLAAQNFVIPHGSIGRRSASQLSNLTVI